MHQEITISKCPQCGNDLTDYQKMDPQPSFCLHCKFPVVLIAGKYRLLRVLGEGGFGTVYYAEHVGLQRNAQRVVKILKPEVFAIEGMKERFSREVQLTSDLSQRNMNIVRIYDDFGEIPNVGHFYVMEYLEGQPLGDYVENPGHLPSISWCLHVFQQLCDAMQSAHEDGVIHRDIKPENILLIKRRKEAYFIKILDFGIARPMEADDPDGKRLTQGVLGTPFYIAPEQGTNRNVDHRADLYSMAVLLYEMLTGYNPFVPPGRENISALELMTCHLMMPAPSMLEMRQDRGLTAGLDAVVLKALSKNPGDRYQSADELWDAIEAAAEPAWLHFDSSESPWGAQGDAAKVAVPSLVQQSTNRNTGTASDIFADVNRLLTESASQPKADNDKKAELAPKLPSSVPPENETVAPATDVSEALAFHTPEPDSVSVVAPTSGTFDMLDAVSVESTQIAVLPEGVPVSQTTSRPGALSSPEAHLPEPTPTRIAAPPSEPTAGIASPIVPSPTPAPLSSPVVNTPSQLLSPTAQADQHPFVGNDGDGTSHFGSAPTRVKPIVGIDPRLATGQLDDMLPDIAPSQGKSKSLLAVFVMLVLGGALVAAYALKVGPFQGPVGRLPKPPDTQGAIKLVGKAPGLRRIRVIAPVPRDVEPVVPKRRRTAPRRRSASRHRTRSRRRYLHRRSTRRRYARRRVTHHKRRLPPRPRVRQKHSNPCTSIGFASYVFLRVSPYSKKFTEVTIKRNRYFKVKNGICIPPMVRHIILGQQGYAECDFSVPRNRKVLRIRLRREGDEVFPQDYCLIK